MAHEFKKDEVVKIVLDKLECSLNSLQKEKDNFREKYWKALEERIKEIEAAKKPETSTPLLLPNIQVVNTDDNFGNYPVPEEPLVGFDKHYGRAIAYIEFEKEGESSRHYYWTRFDITDDNKLSIELMIPYEEEKANSVIASLYKGDLIKVTIKGFDQYLNSLSINPWKVTYKRISVARDDFTTLQLELELM